MSRIVDLIGGENHGQRVRVDHRLDTYRAIIQPEPMYTPPTDATVCQDAMLRTELYKITPLHNDGVVCYVGTPINDRRVPLEIILDMALRGL